MTRRKGAGSARPPTTQEHSERFKKPTAENSGAERPTTGDMRKVPSDTLIVEWLRDAMSRGRPRKLPVRVDRDAIATAVYYAGGLLNPESHHAAIAERPGPALKHARLLLQHLPAEAARLDGFAEIISNSPWPVWNAARMHAGLLRGFETDVREIVAILEASDWRPPATPPWRKCARTIASVLRTRWVTPSGQFLKTTKPDSPLNRFTQLALSWLEGCAERPADTIASAIRDATSKKSAQTVPARRPRLQRANRD